MLVLVTEYRVAPSGQMRVLQYYCKIKRPLQWKYIFVCDKDMLSMFDIFYAETLHNNLYSCKFTSSSRTKGWALVLADTLRRLSIRRIRMKSRTGFWVWWLLTVSSPSLTMLHFLAPWKTWENEWIRPERGKLLKNFVELEHHTDLWNIQRENDASERVQECGWCPQWVSWPEVMNETKKLHHACWKLWLPWCISDWLALRWRKGL